MPEPETLVPLVYVGPYDTARPVGYDEVASGDLLGVKPADVAGFLASGNFAEPPAEPKSKAAPKPKAAPKTKNTPSPVADAAGSDSAGSPGEKE